MRIKQKKCNYNICLCKQIVKINMKLIKYVNKTIKMASFTFLVLVFMGLMGILLFFK